MDKFFKKTLMIMVLSIVGLIIFSSIGLLWDEFGFWLIVFPFIGFLIYSLFENRTPKHIRKIKNKTDKSVAELNKKLAKEYREQQERWAHEERANREQREYEEEKNEKREKERLEKLKYSQAYQQSIKEMNSTKNDCPNCGRSDGRHDPKCYI